MKKHLIAAAVAGAFAVPAMAQVTVSGVLLYDLLQDTKITSQTAALAATTQKISETAAINGNSWTASQIQFSGTEDLGGGLRASFAATVDLRGHAGWVTTRDQNLALSGGFGTIRVGRFVPASAMAFHGYSGAASTTFGSIYGLGTATTTAGAGGNQLNFGGGQTGGNFERNNNLIQFTSPNISGLTVNLSIGRNSNDASNATAGKAETTQQGLSATYVAGPLSVGAGMNEREESREVAAAGTVCASAATGATSVAATCTAPNISLGASSAVTQQTIESSLNWVGASYNLGFASISATQVRREDETKPAAGAVTKNADLTVNSIGVSVPMGAITFAASVYDGENEASAAANDNLDLSGHQASVRYALSKRTTVYALIGENKVKRASGNTAGTTRKQTGSIVGLMHSF